MTHRVLFFISASLISLVVIGWMSGVFNMQKKPHVLVAAENVKAPIAAPARDGNIAIQEELDIAITKNSAEAYQLFIARHPDHYLIPEAKRRLNFLKPAPTE